MKITRRQLFVTYGVSAVALTSTDRAEAQQQPRKEAEPGRAPFWAPGPDKNAARREIKPGPTRVRLAARGLNWPPRNDAGPDAPRDIGSALKALRDQGLSAFVTRSNSWENASEATISELRAALKEFDMEIFEVGGYRNILHPDESSRQENLKYLARCLEVCERIGCRQVGTITGSRNPEGNQWGDNYAVHPDNWTLETWKLAVSGVKQILKDTSGLNAVLGMEAQVTTNLDGPVAHKNFMADVGDPRCKVNLDPTNMIHLYNHFHTTEVLNQCFDLLGEDIMGCHAKDTYVLPHSQTVHVQEVCPGRGRMDYETYILRLSNMKWPRSLLAEHFPAEQNPEAYAYMRKVATKVGVKMDMPPGNA